MLRVFLSREQCFIINDVDLNMLATMLEERANHAFDNAAAAFALALALAGVIPAGLIP